MWEQIQELCVAGMPRLGIFGEMLGGPPKVSSNESRELRKRKQSHSRKRNQVQYSELECYNFFFFF